MQRRFGNQVPPSERRPVAWYAPGVLLQAGRELVHSQDFLRNLDRRESFDDLVVIDFSARPASAEAPFWFDFIADTGDSGNATHAVFRAALRPQLEVHDGERDRALPEGELLIFGGDLAYPGASPDEYQFRFLELLQMAHDPASRFTSSSDPRKFVVAVPQNHDWFDSASTFCRYFVNYDKNLVIGARTPQAQTYFALRLPQRWWALGFDWALEGDLDRKQFEGFAALLEPGPGPRIAEGDNLILVYPEPYWTRPIGDDAPDGYPHRYQRLEAMLERAGARIRLRLAGDLHHYRRERLDPDPETRADSHVVTCGLGGAFLHPTHSIDVSAPKAIDRAPETGAVDEELRHRVRLGRVTPDDERRPRLQPAAAWPPPGLTRALAWRNLWAMFTVRLSKPLRELPWRQLRHELWQSNLGFALCIGLLYGINAYVNAFVFSASFAADGFGPMQRFGFAEAAPLWPRAMAFSPFATLINLAMLCGCIRNAWEGPSHWSGRLAGGLAHGVAHGGAIFALYWAASHALAGLEPSPWLGPASWVLVALGGIVVGGLVFGAHLALMSALFGQLPNNAFGSLAIEDYKGFLRFRLDEHGIEALALGIEKVPREWKRGGAAQDPGWRVIDRFTMRQ
jgi:hypothetical protein